MTIRPATGQDTFQIVNLLKLSLGESLMPKSEVYWRWKHIDNPFGASPVLLAEENSSLAGVRAFMRWEWMHQNKIYKAVRAVDTATHPSHQGKGIFKKLTLQLANSCKNDGINFIFNTPNTSSKPGYLKMGWQTAGKLPVKVNLQRPFRIMKNLLTGSGSAEVESGNSDLKYYLDHPTLAALLQDHGRQVKTMITHISPAYLHWRYTDVPVVRYVGVGEESNGDLRGLIIGRIKPTRFGRELRITDCFIREKYNGRDLIRKLEQSKNEWGVDYTTLSGRMHPHISRIFRGINFTAPVGPTVTVRPLHTDDLLILKNFNAWSPSLGDLELF